MGMKSFGLRHALLMSAAAFGLGMGAAVTPPAYAQEATRSYDIPSQNLDDALREFGRQTGRDVLFTPDAVAGKRSGALAGQMTERQALEALLAGTGLRFEQTRSGGYTVQDPNSPTRLGDARGAAASEDDGGRAEILVIGQRSLNADIRRSEDGVRPYVVFSSEEIERAQAANVEDFLRTRLPMNSQRDIVDQDVFGFEHQGRMNLRGLGPNQTLVLVDGRRLPNVSFGVDAGQPNVNGIPLTAIERIEVLPASAGGIYGGGATGGVINIVLKRDYSGVDLSLSYGNTFRDDAANSRIDATGGFTTENGRLRLNFGVGHSRSEPLRVSDRDFVDRARQLLLTNNPSAILARPPVGFTANIAAERVLDFANFPACSLGPSGFDGCFTAPNLVLDNGTPLNSPRTFVPIGYLGPAFDGGAALLANAGNFNLDTPHDGRTILRDPEVTALSLGGRLQITEGIEVFADLYSDVNESISVAGTERVAILPAASPLNPFQQNIEIRLAIPNLPNTITSRVENIRATLGALFELPGNWAASVEYTMARSEAGSTSTTPLGPAGTAHLQTGLLQDLNQHPLDFSSFLLPGPNNTRGPYVTEASDIVLRVGGAVLSLPAGDITLTALIQHHEEDLLEHVDERFALPNPIFQLYPHKSQTVDSLYVEARVPIVSRAISRPLVRYLELQAAIRYDAYDTTSTRDNPTGPSSAGPFATPTVSTNSVDSTDYSLGFLYEPFGGFAFRANWGTGFLPPGLQQITSNTVADLGNFQGLVDPLRGGTLIAPPFDVIGGGNPDLLPEESESWSIGFIATPEWLPGLRISVDYISIEKQNEILPVTGQFIINNESAYPGRVVRGANLPGDPSSWAGPILSVDTTFANAGSTSVSALDFQVDYEIDLSSLGTLHAYVVATQQTSLERQIIAGGPSFDSVGSFDGPLEWRGNVGLIWDVSNWTFAWNAQHFDSYTVTFANPGLASSNPSLVANQGGASIPSQTYHDLSVRYRFGAASDLLAHTDISLTIQNVFDEAPPILATRETSGGYSPYGDPRMRRFVVALRKHF